MVLLEQWTGDDLEEIVKRCWKRREKTSGHFVTGCIGKKCVATRRAPKLLDLGERDAVILVEADRTRKAFR
jgi:hypothetical protein